MRLSEKIVHVFLGIGILAALLAICFFIFHVPDFWPQLLAIIASAFLGAGVTAWITNTLLDNKQKSEEEKEKNVKVYEEKLRIYQDFLKCLYEVIKDEKVTREEAKRLQFQTAYITMHTNCARIKAIAQQVKNIVNDLNEDNNPRLMQCLFAIVEEFKKELYEKELSDEDRMNIGEACNSFSTIMDAVEVQQNENNDSASDNGSPVDIAQNLNDFVEALRIRLEPSMAKWSFAILQLDNGINIKLGLKDHEEDVHVILNHEEGGEHYFQVHIENDAPHELYKQMKWEFGGRQNKWCWWKYLDANWRLLAYCQEIKTRNWEELLSYVEKELLDLMAYAETMYTQELSNK